MKVKPIEEIKEFCDKFGKDLGITVKEVEFKNGKNPILTVYIKKDDGVMDLDTCEKYHNEINESLDEFDPTHGEPYTLNVSSVGIDWAFRTEEDFISHIGSRVEVKLNVSIKGKKDYDGILTKYDGKSIVIKVSEKLTLSIEMKNVVKVNEYIEFDY